MQTQRDHVHAYQFMMDRLSCALVLGDPGTAVFPARRALTGLGFGILIAVLVAAGFGVYGWIVPGGSAAFREKGAILVEKESGTRYVYLDGVLHPTPNLASAMLLQGGQAKVKLISRNSLRDVPRGPALGIADAPQLVPSPAELTTGPWLACLPGSVVDTPGESLGVNLDPRAVAEPLPAGRFLLVRGPDGARFLIHAGVKHRVLDDVVPVALGALDARPVRAPQRWLDWLPDGPALRAATIAGAGAAGPQVGGRSRPIGTLYRQELASGERRYFVLRGDGLAPVNRTEALFLEAGPAGAAIELDTAVLAGAPRSADRSLLSRLPDLSAAGWQDPGGRVLCLRQQPTSASTYASTVVLAPREQAAVDARGRGFVHAGPASGMLVVAVPGDGTGPAPGMSLISDGGVAFPLADAQAVAALQLGGRPPVPFPRQLLAVLPQGPRLSRAAAAEQITRQPAGGERAS
ncbi:type VII secretion protein EccB [Micromonospora haikouensis]|uniref:type VII secretion protein EccB n=1 Tax=Micromonospora haikouensis TaxID=686309 RepID=UPI0037BCE93F